MTEHKVNACKTAASPHVQKFLQCTATNLEPGALLGKLHVVHEPLLEPLALLWSTTEPGSLDRAALRYAAATRRLCGNGWLSRLRARYIATRDISGEGAAADTDGAEGWQNGQLQQILMDYALENIFNLNESAAAKLQAATKQDPYCPALADIKIKVTKDTKKRDPFLKRAFPLSAVIRLREEHNHMLNCSHACFYTYFKGGLMPAEAIAPHAQKPAAGAVNTCGNTEYHWFRVWHKNAFGDAVDPLMKLAEKEPAYLKQGEEGCLQEVMLLIHRRSPPWLHQQRRVNIAEVFGKSIFTSGLVSRNLDVYPFRGGRLVNLYSVELA
ncbi:hypothetical protein HPB47_001636 [Ixodes persulcatus]|uniref:Uncharacterized protein n=1 Tax=Ixodes persulcatus TaxID=34615 RepID=A0AC60PNH7_IXOPE|nr:hypothetical protein HPB47_001636 [Ixodes persulcatus]